MSAFSEFDEFAEDPISYSNGYVLLKTLNWRVGKRGSKWLLRIPYLYRFDLSVPRGLRWLISPHDRQLLPAAAVHDELLNQGFDRPFAAAEFRRACRARGVGPWKAWALFFAVLAWTSRPNWMRRRP